LYYEWFRKIWLAERRAEVSLAGLSIPLSNRKFSIELTVLSGGGSSLIVFRSFASKVEERANGARYKSQGQARSEAERVAPGKYPNETFRPERPKYTPYYAPSGLDLNFDSLPRGDALRACPWLFYLAPLALYYDFGAKPCSGVNWISVVGL